MNAPVVVLSTRSGRLKTTPEALAACQCDYFDSLLSGRLPSGQDKKGRPKLRLDFNTSVFEHTLTRMQRGTTSVPPWFDEAYTQEQMEQLRFLCHRPTLEADAAAAEAQKVEAAAAAAERVVPTGYVRIEPGESFLGSPDDEPGRFHDEAEVVARITRPYLLKVDKVTQQEFADVLGFNPSHFTTDPPGGLASQCPVEQVTYFHALAWCNAKSVSEALRPCYDLGGWTGRADAGAYGGPDDVRCDWTANGYRLPTHAEWVRAARGGTQGPTYAAAGQGLRDLAWCAAFSGHGNESRTRPVGLEATNAFGVRPLGNVYTWVWDRYDRKLEGGDNPTGPGPDAGIYRVTVGGSYGSDERRLRVAYRNEERPWTCSKQVGFCPARSLFY